MKLSLCLVVLLFVVAAFADIYVHNPRCSNNRLNEQNANTQNENRLFNSQNNARGGYCWGPPMTFYAGSLLSVEWTAQHACGNDNTECQVIVQYMCTSVNANATYVIRDGLTTTRITDTNNVANPFEYDDAAQAYKYGMHESYEYYDQCNARSRNKGLYTADQNMGTIAQSTRQNSNQNNRRGTECQEERDYYPYWAPTPWRDVAILTTNTDDCKYYQSESQNVKAKYYCTGSTTTPQPIIEQECIGTGGKWKSEPAFGIDKPECKEAPWSRDNHLGNGFNGQQNSYNWTLPTAKEEPCMNEDGGCVCVLRLRYNISTAETTSFGSNFTDSRNNGKGENAVVYQDPDVMVAGMNLTLAINTNQYSRTFQDRSHSFYLQRRPAGISNSAKIYNLNVRGKRGNIVQTFPATEYDFVPSHLHTTVGDYVHFQWTGCDTNPAGNAGEGLDQTDRSNIVQIKSMAHNVPVGDDELPKNKRLFDQDHIRSRFSHLGQVNCATAEELEETDANNNPSNCWNLNNAPAYFNGGVHKMNKTGTFFYMSTRNNNFSNRSQKGAISVRPVLYGWQIGLISAGAVVVALGGATAGSVFYAKKNPHSSLAGFVSKVPGLNKI